MWYDIPDVNRVSETHPLLSIRYGRPIPDFSDKDSPPTPDFGSARPVPSADPARPQDQENCRQFLQVSGSGTADTTPEAGPSC